jgi:hypothetical protein
MSDQTDTTGSELEAAGTPVTPPEPDPRAALRADLRDLLWEIGQAMDWPPGTTCCSPRADRVQGWHDRAEALARLARGTSLPSAVSTALAGIAATAGFCLQPPQDGSSPSRNCVIPPEARTSFERSSRTAAEALAAATCLPLPFVDEARILSNSLGWSGDWPALQRVISRMAVNVQAMILAGVADAAPLRRSMEDLLAGDASGLPSWPARVGAVRQALIRLLGLPIQKVEAPPPEFLAACLDDLEDRVGGIASMESPAVHAVPFTEIGPLVQIVGLFRQGADMFRRDGPQRASEALDRSGRILDRLLACLPEDVRRTPRDMVLDGTTAAELRSLQMPMRSCALEIRALHLLARPRQVDPCRVLARMEAAGRMLRAASSGPRPDIMLCSLLADLHDLSIEGEACRDDLGCRASGTLCMAAQALVEVLASPEEEWEVRRQEIVALVPHLEQEAGLFRVHVLEAPAGPRIQGLLGGLRRHREWIVEGLRGCPGAAEIIAWHNQALTLARLGRSRISSPAALLLEDLGSVLAGICPDGTSSFPKAVPAELRRELDRVVTRLGSTPWEPAPEEATGPEMVETPDPAAAAEPPAAESVPAPQPAPAAPVEATARKRYRYEILDEACRPRDAGFILEGTRILCMGTEILATRDGVEKRRSPDGWKLYWVEDRPGAHLPGEEAGMERQVQEAVEAFSRLGVTVSEAALVRTMSALEPLFQGVPGEHVAALLGRLVPVPTGATAPVAAPATAGAAQPAIADRLRKMLASAFGVMRDVLRLPATEAGMDGAFARIREWMRDWEALRREAVQARDDESLAGTARNGCARLADEISGLSRLVLTFASASIPPSARTDGGTMMAKIMADCEATGGRFLRIARDDFGIADPLGPVRREGAARLMEELADWLVRTVRVMGGNGTEDGGECAIDVALREFLATSRLALAAGTAGPDGLKDDFPPDLYGRWIDALQRAGEMVDGAIEELDPDDDPMPLSSARQVLDDLARLLKTRRLDGADARALPLRIDDLATIADAGHDAGWGGRDDGELAHLLDLQAGVTSQQVAATAIALLGDVRKDLGRSGATDLTDLAGRIGALVARLETGAERCHQADPPVLLVELKGLLHTLQSQTSPRADDLTAQVDGILEAARKEMPDIRWEVQDEDGNPAANGHVRAGRTTEVDVGSDDMATVDATGPYLQLHDAPAGWTVQRIAEEGATQDEEDLLTELRTAVWQISRILRGMLVRLQADDSFTPDPAAHGKWRKAAGRAREAASGLMGLCVPPYASTTRLAASLAACRSGSDKMDPGEVPTEIHRARLLDLLSTARSLEVSTAAAERHLERDSTIPTSSWLEGVRKRCGAFRAAMTTCLGPVRPVIGFTGTKTFRVPPHLLDEARCRTLEAWKCLVDLYGEPRVESSGIPVLLAVEAGLGEMLGRLDEAYLAGEIPEAGYRRLIDLVSTESICPFDALVRMLPDLFADPDDDPDNVLITEAGGDGGGVLSRAGLELRAVAGEGALRVAGTQVTGLVRTALVGAARRATGRKAAGTQAERFLASPAGEALLQAVASVLIEAAPLGARAGDLQHALAHELRVGALAGLGDGVLDVVAGPVREVLQGLLAGEVAGDEVAREPVGQASGRHTAARLPDPEVVLGEECELEIDRTGAAALFP